MANGFTGALRTRHDAWKLSAANAWHPDLLWYAKAIASIHLKGITNPVCWRYQAAIHDYTPGNDPFAVPGEAMPSAADQKSFWKQCQHGSWFFLPWHRIYLYYFEAIIASTVVALGGPQDWALPYWNYSDAGNPDALKLPPAFTAAKLPDGTTNALHVAARKHGLNTGGAISKHAVSLTCLTDGAFTRTTPSAPVGFGGPKTIFSHGGPTPGALENVPHGAVHVAVGGPTGWMSSFDTAALDPIFWVHHANIDRLWEVWRKRNATYVNPTDPAWLHGAGAAFRLHDATGAVGALTVPSQVVDTTAAPLHYTYQDLSDPLAPAAPAPAPHVFSVTSSVPPPAHPAEMVGASSAPTTLGAGSVVEHIDLAEPTGPVAHVAGAGAAAPGASGRHVYLHLENVRAPSRAPSYAVYVNLPQGADPGAHEENYAGLLSMFGVAEASRASSEHGGGGLTYVLDITDLVARLAAAGTWDPKTIHVSFVLADDDKPVSGVTVGRVSVYYH